MDPPFNITVLISGGGTTLENLIDRKNGGELAAEIAHVISSNRMAKGNRLASDHSLPLSIVERKSCDSDGHFSDHIFEICRESATDLVVMGGFLKKVVVPPDFINRVINIHPSLIPAFSGQGYYGMNVHRAVIQYGCKVSGCTVHFVDNQYDHGPVIAQKTLAVSSQMTAEQLQKEIFGLECELYPSVINQIATGKISIKDRIVSVAD